MVSLSDSNHMVATRFLKYFACPLPEKMCTLELFLEKPPITPNPDNINNLQQFRAAMEVEVIGPDVIESISTVRYTLFADKGVPKLETELYSKLVLHTVVPEPFACNIR